jgi:hypothetical protein
MDFLLKTIVNKILKYLLMMDALFVKEDKVCLFGLNPSTKFGLVES